MWFKGAAGAVRQLWICQSLFVFESAPTGPWQAPEKPFRVQPIFEQTKGGPISWELIQKQAAPFFFFLKRAVSVFKNGWMVCDTHPN